MKPSAVLLCPEGVWGRMVIAMGLAVTFKKLLIGRAFSTEKGRVRLFGRMDWTMVPSWVFAEILQNLGEEKGPEYLYNLGHVQAIDVGKDIMKCTGIKTRGWTALKAVTDILDFIGFGKVRFTKTDKTDDGQHHFIFHVTDNPVTEYAKKKYGEKSMVCQWFMGVYAGHGEFELGIKNVKIKETACVCKGAPCCVWETKWKK